MAPPSLCDEALEHLRCPACRGALDLRSGDLEDGNLACEIGHTWPIRGGLPHLFVEEEVRGNDRLLRLVYDRLAPLHDPATALVLPLIGTGTSSAIRASYMPRLELRSLTPPSDRPLRILEVGIGTGANVPWVQAALPVGADYEIWGVDLAEGMLELCRRRLADRRGSPVRLAVADAHALPFEDHSFDRVFHVGATNNYRDPKLALREMARVAVPGSPIVVVDERLDAAQPQSAYHRLMYRLLTFYESAPVEPVRLVPPEAIDVLDEQVERFFYCLTFRMPR